MMVMTEIEKDILNSLVELEQTVQALPTSNPKPNLLPLFNRLEQLTAQLPKSTAPDLLHYLHRKSYQKAHVFLESQS